MFRFQEKTRNGPPRAGSWEWSALAEEGKWIWDTDMSGDGVSPSPPAESLAPGESATAVMGINFCDSTQAANFQLW